MNVIVLCKFRYQTVKCLNVNKWLALANGIRRDDRGQRMIIFGQLHSKGWLGQTID
jgi:hypothetical protein